MKKKAHDRLSKTMIIKNNVIIVNDIRKSYFKRLKKWIIELENKIKKKIKKINKINNSKIVRNVAFFVVEKITSELARLQKEINELNIQIAADDVAKEAEVSAYKKIQNVSFEVLQTDEISQILNIMKDLKLSYLYLNSGDDDYITLYHLNTSIDFASLYKLQNYRYIESRFSSLMFLNK